MKKFRGILIAAILIPTFFFYLGLGLETGKSAPKHSLVFVDTANAIYIAPPCVSPEKAGSYEQVTIQVARERKLEPDDNCRNAGGFVQEGRSVSGRLIERLGLIKPLKSRWNEDGSWNW